MLALGLQIAMFFTNIVKRLKTYGADSAGLCGGICFDGRHSFSLFFSRISCANARRSAPFIFSSGFVFTFIAQTVLEKTDCQIASKGDPFRVFTNNGGGACAWHTYLNQYFFNYWEMSQN